MQKPRKLMGKTSLVTVLAVAFLCFALVVPAFAAQNLSAKALTMKTTKRQVSIAWKSVPDTAFYSVWRSLSSSGEGASCVGVVQSKKSTSYVDQSVTPGTTYYYAVRSVSNTDLRAKPNKSNAKKIAGTGELSWRGPVKLEVTWDGEYSPHLGSKFTAKHESGCRTCHSIVSTSKTSGSMLNVEGQKTVAATTTQKCLECHMESKAPAQPSVGALFVAGGSGHEVATNNNPNATLTCSTCHDPHADSSTNAYLTPKTITVGNITKKVTEGDNGTCLTCHDDAQTWYTETTKKTYPKTSEPNREMALTDGYFDYPILGTFTGATAYVASPHASIKATGSMTKGDCRYCHNAHRSDAPYDGLATSYRGELRAMKALGDGSNVVNPSERLSGDYAAFCLSCHGSDRNELSPNLESKEATTTNIRALVVPSESEVATSTAGHVVSSPNATVPEGSALPCYTCHNPHGSQAGNVKNLSDEIGEGVKDTDLDRNVCFGCHATSEGKVYDFKTFEWVKANDKDLVVGLSRTGVDKTLLHPEGVPNKLLLTAIGADGVEDAHSQTSTVACSTCHVDAHRPDLYGEAVPVIEGSDETSATPVAPTSAFYSLSSFISSNN